MEAPQKSEVTSTEEEVIAKITEPSIHFEPWAPLAKDKILMKLDEIITVYEAHDEIIDKYNQLVEVDGRGMIQQQVKLILLKNRSEYLIGKVTELDEEPSVLIENCYEVTDEDTIIPFPEYHCTT